MSWSSAERKGAIWIALGTVAMIVLSISYLWYRAGSSPEIDPWDFLKISIVVSLVWAAIGVTMGIFVVMVLRKNTKES